MKEKVRFKIAFLLPWAKYDWKRRPLELVGAPFTFAEGLVLMLGCLDFLVVFYDDILIFSETLEKHIKHVSLPHCGFQLNHIYHIVDFNLTAFTTLWIST